MARVGVTAVPAAPTKLAKSPFAHASPDLRELRARLAEPVGRYGLDPGNAWAIGHALQGLGADAKMADGVSAVDFLFDAYAERERIDGTEVVRFAGSRGAVRIEPHSGLTLKILTDSGVSPERVVQVAGAPATVADLWRGTVISAWVDGEQTSFGSWNDTPWALQGLVAWAPAGLAWTAAGGHAMTADGFTHAVVQKLAAETAFLAEAQAAGSGFEKKRQGIFAYTCGGAHLLQGAAYAVARGFGAPEDRATVVAQLHLQAWRFPKELQIVDDTMVQAPTARSILLVQRLKMVGHHLETMERAAAQGLVSPSDADIVASIALAEGELLSTGQSIVRSGAFDAMPQVRAANEQVYLDLIGDSAHAIHAIDLATGDAGVWL